MSASFIIPDVGALQIPSDNKMLQASSILPQYSSPACHYTVASHNPPTSIKHMTLEQSEEEDEGARHKGAGGLVMVRVCK